MGSVRWLWIIIVILIVIIVYVVIRPPCPPCPPVPTPQETQAELGTTVKIILAVGSDPGAPHLSRSGDNNHIRWENTTTAERTVEFTSIWPFYGDKTDIVIPAGGKSQWYTLDPLKENATCAYRVNPSLFDSDVTPDGPVVSADD